MPEPASTEPPSETASKRPLVSPRVQIGVYAVVLILVGAAETARWVAGPESPLIPYVCGEHADWLPFLPWLLAAPPFWYAGRVARWGHRVAAADAASVSRAELRCAWAGAVLVAFAAFAASLHVRDRFNDLDPAYDNLPPAYHDEYSYLFQARTFLAGCLSFPSFEPMPELFDQMHVLNEGRFASRYFAGTGLWMAPFVATGNPWLGHWVANATAAFFLFWAGREIGGNLVGFVGGLLFAASPGIALFSDLLLAHQPTLVGLMLFLWAFLRMKRTGSLVDAMLAGIGLTFAMLCRPMTAFGIGLPFGVYFAWWLLTGRGVASVAARNPVFSKNRVSDTPVSERSTTSIARRAATAIALGSPILLGLIAMCGYNKAITGDPWTTPYQLYTDIYTPRHRYGFNNVVRGEQRLGPKVLENYDRWAENLDAPLAARNVWRRTIASLRWTLGIVPLLAAALVLLFSRTNHPGNIRLVAAAILCLHLVHVPYWFEGIMGWHYVFESAPFWLLLFAEATRRLWISLGAEGKLWMAAWWLGLVGIAVAVNLVTVEPLWPGRLQSGIAEVSFSRLRYAAFQDEARRIAAGRRIIVFVEPDPADRHIDYVVNDPSLDGEVLRARYRAGRTDLAGARALFPDRDAWLYRAATGEWISLP
jgi:hypothetical protein